jgi:hypothetical protein
MLATEQRRGSRERKDYTDAVAMYSTFPQTSPNPSGDISSDYFNRKLARN